MAYRSKSQARAYEELRWLGRGTAKNFVSADTILDMRYFEGFLPRLAADGPAITMYFQMKANLRPDQLVLLSRAGIKEDPARHRVAEHPHPRPHGQGLHRAAEPPGAEARRRGRALCRVDLL